MDVLLEATVGALRNLSMAERTDVSLIAVPARAGPTAKTQHVAARNMDLNMADPSLGRSRAS
jgi:hypothetical protein